MRASIEADGGPVVKITAQEAKISRGKLKRYVPVFEEQSVNNDLLVSGARNLRDYFQFQGYFDVQVDFKIATPIEGPGGNYIPDRSRRATSGRVGYA